MQEGSQAPTYTPIYRLLSLLCFCFLTLSLTHSHSFFLLFKRRKKRNWMKYTCYIIFTLSDRGWRHFLMFSFFAIYMWESERERVIIFQVSQFISTPFSAILITLVINLMPDITLPRKKITPPRNGKQRAREWERV
jgi:hypothetical protein